MFNVFTKFVYHKSPSGKASVQIAINIEIVRARIREILSNLLKKHLSKLGCQIELAKHTSISLYLTTLQVYHELLLADRL